jgi:hypothetical protein
MTWWVRTVVGMVGGACIGVAFVFAGAAERSARGGPNPTDAAAASPFVVRAQRGEVAAPGLDDVEHMCALLISCDKLPIPPTLFPPDFQACVHKMSDEMASPAAVNFSLTMRECGLQADSCASLRMCALHGASPDACKARGRQGVVGFCDVDGRALTCWHDEVLAVRDCTRGGEQCIVLDGEATCTLGACPANVKDGDRSRCSASGTHLLHCEKGKLASLNCAAFGLQCTAVGGGTAGCATGGPLCSGATKRCDGNVAVGCFNGHEVRVDCGSAGLACAPAPGAIPVGACVAPPPRGAGGGSSCDSTDKAACDGDSIRYCHAGGPRSYSCKALGFRRCDAGKNGVRCAP